MAQNPEQMLANLKAKTGHDLKHWLKIARASGLEKHCQIVQHLKTEHGLTHGYANVIAHQHLGAGRAETSGVDLVDAQYAGAKAALRPNHDALTKAVKRFGKAVEVAPKKTYVSLRRTKQFALVQPSRNTRVALSIDRKGTKPTKRLEASGSFHSMVSHRVRIESVDDVDAELIGWLRAAYDAS